MGYLVTLAFDGSGYCGWQVQKSGRSVQSVFQDACEAVFSLRPDVTGCSRTDSGVHARGFAALIDASGVPENALPLALNAHLPPDIAVTDAVTVPDSFHPRYDAKSKEYIYTVRNCRIRDPFIRKYCWLVPQKLDDGIIASECAEFVGRHDFGAFMASGSKITDTVRTVFSFEARREGEILTFRVNADGYLYNMVRIMVGTVVGRASGAVRMPCRDIIASKNRKNAGMTAPASGLCLNRVFY